MNNNPAGAKTRDILLTALTFAAGSLDALSFLTLGAVFSSFMSGNTLTLGLRIGLGDFPLALNSMTAVFGYIAGVALGANIGYESSISHKVWPYATTKVLAVEFLIIILFTGTGSIAGNSSSNVVYLLILLASISMGMQSTAVRGLGVSGVTTTYVTGTWTSFIIGLVGLRRSYPLQRTIKEKQDTIVQAITLVAYVVGAATGGLVEAHFSFETAIVPASIIGCVLVVAWIRFRQIG
jgi:uncharacterized membrane protein YoaK (UPF0700 family)